MSEPSEPSFFALTGHVYCMSCDAVQVCSVHIDLQSAIIIKFSNIMHPAIYVIAKTKPRNALTQRIDQLKRAFESRFLCRFDSCRHESCTHLRVTDAINPTAARMMTLAMPEIADWHTETDVSPPIE